MVDKRRKKEVPEMQVETRKPELISHAVQDEKTADRPKYNTSKIVCPYCDVEEEQKIKFSFSGAIPNLIECGNCHNHFIVQQKVEIINTIIDIQHQLDSSSKSANVLVTGGEAGTRDASF